MGKVVRRFKTKEELAQSYLSKGRACLEGGEILFEKQMAGSGITVVVTGCGHLGHLKEHFPEAKIPLASS